MVVADPLQTRAGGTASWRASWPSGCRSTTSTTLHALQPAGQPVRLHRAPRAGRPGDPAWSTRPPRRGLQGAGHAQRPGEVLPRPRRGGQPGRLHGHRRSARRSRAQRSTSSSPGTDGSETYEVGAGNRIPLGHSTVTPAHNGADLHTTIDEDLQWYTQRVLRQTVLGARGDSGFAVVMDSQSGELLALADYPTYDASNPTAAPKRDRNSLAMTSPYEPGLGREGAHPQRPDRRRARSPTRPGCWSRVSCKSGDRVIHDWFPHGDLRLTLAGVIAQSSNIGTAKSSRLFKHGQLRHYLTGFGLGQRTDIGVNGETSGPAPDERAVERDAAGPDRLRPERLGQRRPDGGSGQHDRQRRRPRLAEPDRGQGHDGHRSGRRDRRDHHATAWSARTRPTR